MWRDPSPVPAVGESCASPLFGLHLDTVSEPPCGAAQSDTPPADHEQPPHAYQPARNFSSREEGGGVRSLRPSAPWDTGRGVAASALSAPSYVATATYVASGSHLASSWSPTRAGYLTSRPVGHSAAGHTRGSRTVTVARSAGSSPAEPQEHIRNSLAGTWERHSPSTEMTQPSVDLERVSFASLC